MTGALIVFITLQTLGWSGCKSPPEGVIQFSQSESALMAIRLMVSLLGTSVLAGSIALAWSYPLSREKHERIQQLLKRRREEKI